MGWGIGLSFLLPMLLAIIAMNLLMWLLGEASPVGDETDYVACGGREDPLYPQPFLRVPLMAMLSRLAHRNADPAHRLRLYTRRISLLTLFVAGAAAWIQTGTAGAVMVGLLLALSPSRALYANHIWPDNYLAFWLSLLCLILIVPDMNPGLRCGLLGLICALAFLTRFDALVSGPLTLLAIPQADASCALLLLLPSVAAFVALSIRNGRKYWIPLPDDTWLFNLTVSLKESRAGAHGPVLVDSLVDGAFSDWRRSGRQVSVGQTLLELLRRPHRLVMDMLRRAWSMAGTDTFASENLLPPHGWAYSRSSERGVAVLRRLLQVEFPLLVSITLGVIWLGPVDSQWVWPTLAFMIGNLLFTRTRFRQAWLPGMMLILSDTLLRGAKDWSTEQWLTGGMAVILLFLVLLRFRTRSER